MDRLQQYLEVVPLPVLFLLLAGAGLAAVAVPGRLRLPLMLLIMPPWLSLGQFLALGTVQAVAKATGFVMFALLALAAYLHPGPKRHLSPWVWIYPIVAIFMIPFVGTTEDRAIALVIQVQWLIMTFASIMVARTIVTEDDLVARMRMMSFGLAGVILAVLLEVVRNPSVVFARGVGRIEPWGADPNQIGTVMVMGVPLLFFFGLREKRLFFKLGFLAFAGLGMIVGLATGSRSTLFPLALMLPVIGARYVFKPLTLLAIGFAAVVAFFASRSFVSEVDTSRLSSLESGRYETWRYYFDNEIMARPLTGLLGTSGLDSVQAAGWHEHPHNAYIQLFYRFGIVITLPMLALAAMTMAAAFKLWRYRSWFSADPTLMTTVAIVLAAVYFHGIPTTVIYHPTYAWAFFHVMLSAWAISVAREGQPVSPELYEDDWGELPASETDAATEAEREPVTA